MILIVWAVAGVVVGIVGSEVLRSKKPNLIRKVEGAAKQFVDSIYPEDSGHKNFEADDDRNALD